MHKKYLGIGLMSGTSLDGLDMVACNFVYEYGKWSYEVLAFKELPYNNWWQDQLSGAFHQSTAAIDALDLAYGDFLGQQVDEFVKAHQLKPDFLASHGHTVFHRPSEKVSLQIGHGQRIANSCGITTVSNFRMADVLRGGQGAPLVPVGDRLLFGDYTYCLNIGGISNVSYESEGQRIAFDIGPANMVLNHLAARLGKPFDKDGTLAGQGRPQLDLLLALDALPYFQKQPPKSLGREWVEQEYMSVLERFNYSVNDLLATCTLQIGKQIGSAIPAMPGKVLITGGGAFNKVLVNAIGAFCHHELVIPDPVTVKMKEAIVFAFLGLLRLRGEVNCLSSVTGARADSSTGDVFLADY